MTRKMLTDEELDRLVVRALSSLPVLAPSRGFADRVMARVQLPPPWPVRMSRRLRSWLAKPRHAAAAAAAYSAAAIVALAVAGPWLLANVPAARSAASWVASQMNDVAREALLRAASWAVSAGLADAARGISLTGPAFWVGCFGISAAYAACVLGLRRVLREPARENDASVRIPV